MNRKLAIASLGLLGLIGFGNVARCVDSEEPSQGCSIEEKVEENIDRISSIEEDAERLNKVDSRYRLNGEELVFLTRMIYFEDGSFAKHLREGFSKDEVKRSNEAIASVLLNRYKLDSKNDSNKFHKKGSNGSLITYAKFENAFSCLKDRKGYFDSQTFYDPNGNLSLKHKGLDQEYLDVAYSALVSVLEGADDPTSGALFYKTKSLGRSGKEVWHGTEAFWLNGSSCKRDWNVDITNHQYYGVNCE
jgi:hypothetical protein